jgi:coatomer protein complex subunit gamma
VEIGLACGSRLIALDPGPAAMDIVAPSPIAQEASQPTAANIQSLYTAQLQSVPELEPYGPVLRSSTKPVALTESETEYVVTAVKHIFKEHIVFQVSRLFTLFDVPR